jgi:hypothetical protein
METSPTVWLAWMAAFGLAACTPPPASPPPIEASRYANPASWLCLPGRKDVCATDLTATVIHADGTRAIAPFQRAVAPKADCFYVYPTVDLSLIPKNHDDFSSLEPMAETTVAQVARFQESCALYVPLYRQVTIGTYLQKSEWRERALAVAFADVEASFKEYLANRNHGRPIILLGHSQGAEMVVRLVRRFFDDDTAMRQRLLVAMAIGGDLEAPSGQAVGGTFAQIPACTSAEQTGCVIAYHSFARSEDVNPGRSAPRPGNETLCVNPADVEHNGLAPMSGAAFPLSDRNRRFLKGVEGVQTPFVVLPDFYAGQCVKTEGGFRYLAVSLVGAPGDARPDPVDLGRRMFRGTIGLHILDYQLPQGDLLNLVRRRVEKLP